MNIVKRYTRVPNGTESDDIRFIEWMNRTFPEDDIIKIVKDIVVDKRDIDDVETEMSITLGKTRREAHNLIHKVVDAYMPGRIPYDGKKDRDILLEIVLDTYPDPRIFTEGGSERTQFVKEDGRYVEEYENWSGEKMASVFDAEVFSLPIVKDENRVWDFELDYTEDEYQTAIDSYICSQRCQIDQEYVRAHHLTIMRPLVSSPGSTYGEYELVFTPISKAIW